MIRELETLGGCPEDVLRSDDLMDLFIPILRADFGAAERYAYKPGAPLAIPLAVFLGNGDEVPWEWAESWRQETSGAFSMRRFPGNHFFPFEHVDQFADAVLETLGLVR